MPEQLLYFIQDCQYSLFLFTQDCHCMPRIVRTNSFIWIRIISTLCFCLLRIISTICFNLPRIFNTISCICPGMKLVQIIFILSRICSVYSERHHRQQNTTVRNDFATADAIACAVENQHCKCKFGCSWNK